ncbi:RNA polymerase sigma-70 factor (ECF subfamily) [Agromyces ramosus]|uniref:RNA polymerase sigma-70 factor (ECF subfamily) n=1 Tax=Agromyces ramosus TaxID=33879 RepID=A0A4Q7MIQ9_9MICO|nr:RNA polymerase sigma factor SigJ [Agromyces ramosus]RZS68235.1 RNA polymerase sigma-70 factor (ECF subfamily) [Agromyces ramosus]
MREPEAEALGELLEERTHLMNLAFRMLGSANDAEDVVQQAYVHWFQLDDAERAAIERPRAWLTTVASRICLNILDSARVRRERYVGEWLPEPLPSASAGASVVSGVSTAAVDPLDRITLDDSVSMALLVVLESLTPAERVAFVLHEVFGVPFAEIGEIVGRSPEATRQLASSARRHVRDLRARPTDAADHARLVAAFRRACEVGDLDALVRILDPEVTSTSDGGGKVRAALRPVVGAENVARFLLGVLRKAQGLSVAERDINGERGLVVSAGDQVVGTVSLGTAGGRIHDVWIVMNPDKLAAWNR